MRFIPLVLFFLYAYIEISVFVVVANAIGVFLALILIIATSVLGISIVKSQGMKNIVIMQQKMAKGENPTNEAIRSVSLVLAGLFLLIPGFVTDIIGALFLLTPVQKWMTRFLVPKISVSGRFYSSSSSHSTIENDDIINGEFTRKDDDK